uniref:Exoribonuclease phosphorolytic domain-containing protein n=1 Tax=Parascaris univalens TaxID=6257 RepID=A0A915B7R1_PARUN
MEVQCTSMPSSSSGIDSTISKLRQLRAELSFLPRTDGSCALEQGNTVMWASINGPGDVPSSKRLDEKLYIEVVYRHGQSNLCSVEENRILSSILEQTVDTIQYPHKMLAVTIQEMQSDGSEMAAGVTAVCLALLDSGIIMNGIFCGICVAHCDDTLILDPCRKIIINADSLFTFVFKSSAIDHKERTTRMVECQTRGVFEYATFEAAMRLARDASAEIFLFLRETMQRKLSIDSWMIT